MAIRRTHILLNDDLLAAIDKLVGRRKRSKFIAEAASSELLCRQQVQALERATGCWCTPTMRGTSG